MSFRVAISGFLCAVGVSVAAACVWAKTPASLPSTQEANPELAKQFLDAGKIALDKSQAPQAIEALNRSIQNDPDTLEAYLLLGKAYSLANDPCRAVANHRLALQLAGKSRDGAQAAVVVRQATAEITRLCPQSLQWDKFRADWSKKFRDVAPTAAGMPSAIRTLEAAKELCPEDEAIEKEMTESSKKLPWIPGVPDKTDMAGAKLLADGAKPLISGGKHVEAVVQLENACAQAQCEDILITLAEEYKVCKRLPEAARTADRALRLLTAASPAVLRTRAEALLHSIDPGHPKFDALVVQFAPAALKFANDAVSAKDLVTAEAVAGVIRIIQGGSDELIKLSDRIAGRRGMPIDLTSPAVTCSPYPKATLTKTRNSVEARWTLAAPPANGGFPLTFNNLMVGKSLRVHYKAEALQPPSADHKAHFPIHMPIFYLSIDEVQAAVHFYNNEEKRDYAFGNPNDRSEKSLFRDSGSYDIVFEKTGTHAEIWIDGVLAREVELTAEEDHAFAATPLKLSIGRECKSTDNVQVRLTILEMAYTPDCVAGK